MKSILLEKEKRFSGNRKVNDYLWEEFIENNQFKEKVISSIEETEFLLQDKYLLDSIEELQKASQTLPIIQYISTKTGLKREYKMTKQAQKDFDSLKGSPLHNKIEEIIDKICQDPHCPGNKFKRLTGELRGYFSRRITKADRIVYTIKDNLISIVSCKGHYEHIPAN